MSKVVLSGEEHTLKLTMNAICSWEEVTGKNFIEFTNSLKKKGVLSVQVSDMRALLWAELLHEDKDTKLSEAGDLMTFENISEVMEAVAQAVAEAMPKTSESDKKKTKPAD